MLMIVNWDSATEAPKGCFEKRGKYIGVVSDDLYELETSKEYIESIQYLYEHQDQLDEVLAHEIIEIKKKNDKQRKIPKDEYIKYVTLMASSENKWAQAKNNNDFQAFLPILQAVVDFNQKYMKWLETDELKGYDILLDEYETGFSSQEYDEFFALLKEKLVPLVKKINAAKYLGDLSFTQYTYPKAKQLELAKYIEDVMCYDHEHGIGKESEHPFTSGSGTFDVRYTNHFYEDNFISSVYSAIHELGHATYELQVDPQLDNTFVGGGASMAMHESQSRFYENMIGRSKAFIETHFPKFKSVFTEQFSNTTVDDLYYYVNKVENSLIRTEADELTYPLHIMIRYDLEKALLSGELACADLPKAWNAKVSEYLGIEVPNDKAGCLQDVHWAGGLFGYFPTYALGSAYAAQIYHAMSKDIDIDAAIKSGTTKAINAWLKEHIHKYGASKYPKDILMLATKEAFNPNYYVDYLVKRYSEVYKLDK